MKYFSFLLSLLILVQTQLALAGKGTISDGSLIRISTFVSYYNQLSSDERLELINYHIKDFVQSDLKGFKGKFSNFKNVKLPDLNFESGKLSVKTPNTTVEIVLTSDNSVMYQGKEFSLIPGELMKTWTDMEKLSKNNPVSFFDHFLSSAHAEASTANIVLFIGLLLACIGGAIATIPVAAAIGSAIAAAGVIAATFGAGFSFLTYITDNMKLKEFCEKASLGATEIISRSSAEELSLAKETIDKALATIREFPRCKRDSKNELCHQSLSCVDRVKQEILSRSQGINSNERNPQKPTPGNRREDDTRTKANQQ